MAEKKGFWERYKELLQSTAQTELEAQPSVAEANETMLRNIGDAFTFGLLPQGERFDDLNEKQPLAAKMGQGIGLGGNVAVGMGIAPALAKATGVTAQLVRDAAAGAYGSGLLAQGTGGDTNEAMMWGAATGPAFGVAARGTQAIANKVIPKTDQLVGEMGNAISRVFPSLKVPRDIIYDRLKQIPSVPTAMGIGSTGFGLPAAVAPVAITAVGKGLNYVPEAVPAFAGGLAVGASVDDESESSSQPNKGPRLTLVGPDDEDDTVSTTTRKPSRLVLE